MALNRHSPTQHYNRINFRHLPYLIYIDINIYIYINIYLYININPKYLSSILYAMRQNERCALAFTIQDFSDEFPCFA